LGKGSEELPEERGGSLYQTLFIITVEVKVRGDVLEAKRGRKTRAVLLDGLPVGLSRKATSNDCSAGGRPVKRGVSGLTLGKEGRATRSFLIRSLIREKLHGSAAHLTNFRNDRAAGKMTRKRKNGKTALPGRGPAVKEERKTPGNVSPL